MGATKRQPSTFDLAFKRVRHFRNDLRKVLSGQQYPDYLLNLELELIKEEYKLTKAIAKQTEFSGQSLKLAKAYIEQAEGYFDEDNFLEFHSNLHLADRSLFFVLLNCGHSDLLSLKKTAYERALWRKKQEDSLDKRGKKHLSKLDKNGNLDIREWLEVFNIINGDYLTSGRETIEKQKENSRRIRRLAFFTTMTALLAISILSLPLMSGISLPVIGTLPSIPAAFETALPSMFLVYVMVFGALGAAVSGLLSDSTKSSSTNTNDPVLNNEIEHVGGIWTMVAKLTLGAAAALVVFIIFESGFLQTTSSGSLTPGFLLVIAFASGFSERLLVGAMEAIKI